MPSHGSGGVRSWLLGSTTQKLASLAPRRPAHAVTFRNRWGDPPGFEVPEPLWTLDGEPNRDRTGELLVW